MDPIKSRAPATRAVVAFPVYLSDGACYLIRSAENVAVSKTDVVIGIDLGDDAIPERLVDYHPDQLTRIEPLENDG